MPLAHVYALASAVLGAVSTICVRQGLRGGGAYTGLWINCLVGTIGLWVAVVVTGAFAPISATGLAFFVLAGLIGTVGGRLLRFVAIEKVGASIAAALTNLNPLVSSILAILLLGEHVTLPILVGTIVIVLGATLLSAGGRRLGFRPWHLVIPLGSALCFGVVAIVRKLGLSHTNAVLGSAINVTTALIAFTTFLLASGRGELMACRGRSLAYFVGAGAAENTGVFLNVVALGIGTVSVVAPLQGAAPVFVLVLSFFFLRDVEKLSWRIVAGTLLIVLGVYLITGLSSR